MGENTMYQIRHSKLPIRLISQDPLTPNMLDTIAVNMTYTPNEDGKDSPWELWVDEYGDCLLYTSPSPRDRTRSRMPSSA